MTNVAGVTESPFLTARSSSLTGDESEPSLASTRNWWSFWLLGLFNNLSYVVILAGARSLCCSFGQLELLGAIQWALVGVGVFTRCLNTFCLEGVPVSTRMLVCSLGFVVGYVGIVLSIEGSFWLAVFSIIIMGGACSFGESLLLGFMRKYPPAIVGGWSSGTGMAGVGGAGFYLGMWSLLKSDSVHCSDQEALMIIYALMIPSAAIYLLTFQFGVTRPGGIRGGCVLADGSTDEYRRKKHLLLRGEDEPGSIMHPAVAVPSEDPQDQTQAKDEESGSKRIYRVLCYVFSPSIQLALVYFFEYNVSTGFAAHAVEPINQTVSHDGTTAERPFYDSSMAYQILVFTYQAGVLVSRSSLKILRVKRIALLTSIQAANFVLWFLHVIFYFMPPWLQVANMFFTGLLGGAMYVNVFANLVDDPKIHKNDRELAINLTALFVNAGIVSSSLFEIIADHTFLAHASNGTCTAGAAHASLPYTPPHHHGNISISELSF